MKSKILKLFFLLRNNLNLKKKKKIENNKLASHTA